MQLPLFRRPIYKLLNIIGIVLTLLLIVLALAQITPFYYLVIVILIWLSIMSWGAFKINSGLFISTVNNAKLNAHKIALTFDDGPHENTKAILALLEKYNAKSTFFITGLNAEKMPELIREINNAGHLIGNHTYSHSRFFPFFQVGKMVEEIAKTSIIIKKLTGKQPKFFRPPFGITNPRIAKATKKTNLDVIGWSVRSLDTVSKSPDKIVSRIIKRTKPGSIILLHDYSMHSEYVLEQILKYFSGRNYSFITVEELLKTSVE
jgi:peptidoglycan-N-acetylglucosamine deacetylase